MQRVQLDIAIGAAEAGERFSLYGSADAAGRAGASVDFTRPLTGPKPVAVVPLGGDADTGDVRRVTAGPLYFGRYWFVARAEDALGNPSSDPDQEFAVVVNSGPKPVQNLRHSATVAGRPVFSFAAPAQLRD